MKNISFIIGTSLVLVLTACSTQYMEGIGEQENPFGNTENVNNNNDDDSTSNSAVNDLGSKDARPMDATPADMTRSFSQADATMDDLDALRTPSDAAAQPESANLLTTPEHGTLVEAPTETIIVPAEKPTWAQEAVAAATVTTAEGTPYIFLVFTKEPEETLTTWSSHHQSGQSGVPEDETQTRNGKTVYFYESNDFGLVSEITATIVSTDYVYQLRYNDDWGDDPVVAAQRAQAQEAQNAEVKEELTHFVQSINVE